MTENHEPLKLCPLGFTVQKLDRHDYRQCGYNQCFPTACQRVKQAGEWIKCVNWPKDDEL